MKLVPSSVGGKPWQIALLGGLVVALGAVFWINRNPSLPPEAAAQTSKGPVAAVDLPTPVQQPPRTAATSPMPARRTSSRGDVSSTDEFRPSLKLPEGTDVSRIDPTLRVELLAKLRSLPMEGGANSIFDFSQAPPPPPPKVADIKPGPLPETVKITPVKAEPPKPAGPPPPPPIPLKFYGYANTPHGGPKRAFFLDGDDIFVAGENDVIRNRYKVIRIGVNSAVVEDTTNKNQQTLPLVEELPG